MQTFSRVGVHFSRLRLRLLASFHSAAGPSRALNAAIPSIPFDLFLYAKHFGALITDLSKNPNNPKLLSALDSMLSHSHLLDSTTSVLVLRGLSSCRKLSRVRSILLDLKNKAVIPETFLYSLVLQCLVRDGPVRDADSVWMEVSKGAYDLIGNASDFLVRLCEHGGDASEVEVLYQRVSSSRYDLRREAYVALIHAMCRKDGNLNANLVRSSLREMEEKEFEADGSTYFALFQSFCRNGDVSEADWVLRGLVDRSGYELKIEIYDNFLDGLCRSGKLREARKLFDKMVRKNSGTGMDLVPVLKPRRRAIFQLNPSSSISYKMAFEAYLASLCRNDRTEEAERFFREAVENNMKLGVCTHRLFIEALFRARRVNDAMEIFGMAKKQKKGSNLEAEISCTVINGLCKIGRSGDAYKLLQELPGREFTSSWNCVIEGYWKEGKTEEAMALFERMRDKECGGFCRPEASTYGVMIHGFLAKRNHTKVMALFSEMVDEKISVDVDLYKGIVRSLCASGELEEVHKHLNIMIDSGILVSYAAWENLFDSMSMGHLR